MAALPRTGRHRVAVLARHGVLPLELGLVHQLFRSAGVPGGDRPGASGAVPGTPLYDVVTCAPVAGTLQAAADFRLHVEHGPEVLAEADTVLVPASHAHHGGPEADGELTPELAAALARIRPGARIASVCTGAFVLAAAGLLDGRPATTHWKSAERFRRLFPRVRLDPDVLYTDDGDVLTSAGEAAGIDLCLHIIRSDHGAAVAGDVARATVVAPHRDGGQAQFVPRPVAGPGPAAATGEARAWAVRRLDAPLSVADLATRQAMSVRGFSRRFREETGTTPMRWLAGQRLARARQLLEETDLSVEQVAARSGLGTGAALRQRFRDTLGVSPTSYRRTFRTRR